MFLEIEVQDVTNLFRGWNAWSKVWLTNLEILKQ